MLLDLISNCLARNHLAQVAANSLGEIAGLSSCC